MLKTTYTRLSVYRYQILVIDNHIYATQRFQACIMAALTLLQYHQRWEPVIEILCA